MPRKINYGFDGGYDDYEDYDYDYDDEDDSREVPGPEQEVNRNPVWRCSICTYDNDENMTACDICGVIRNPTPGDFKTNSKTAADSMYKDSGVSKMAKSLFASSPQRRPQKAVVGQRLNVSLVTEENNKFLGHGSFQGNFHEFHESYSTSSHVCDIAPFKFDVPSPDDLVFNGLRSSKMGSKGVTEKNCAASVQSGSKRSDSSSKGMKKVEHDKSVDISYSLNGAAVTYASYKNSDTSASVPRHIHNGVDGSHLKDDVLDTQIGAEKSNSSSGLMTKGKNKRMDDDSFSVKEDMANNPTSNLNKMTFSDKSGSSKIVDVGRCKSQVQYRPDKWMLPDKVEDTLTQLNLAIVGHVDSGKSTLSGRVLHLLGRISQKEMHKYEKEAKLQGKGSFAYAWALDESSEERERGITMTVAVAYFDSKKYHVVVLDSPGHKDFVPNMISGATQADAAILVIDACNGAFEAGMDSTKGQTREHAQLIRSFGVDQIIVAVNKMDAVEYSKDRFELIRTQVGTFLRSRNFKDSNVSWIPLSAMENQNLVAPPSDPRLSSWYSGPFLLDAIDSLQPPARDFSKPLVMPICDVIKSSSQGQVSACGKLEAGALRSGLKVLVMPSGDVGTVRSLERDSQACDVARAGDNVAVTLQGIDGNNVIAGGVLCHPDFPVAVAKHLELKVLVLDGATPILIGSQLEFHIHHAKEAARVVRIISLLDSKTGKVTKKAPRCLTPKQNAVIEVVLHSPVCVEEFSISKALGRVFLRASGRTIAAGIVTRIIEEQE